MGFNNILAENARLELAPLVGQVLIFRGTLIKISEDGFKSPTYLLVNIVCLENGIKTQHCWVNHGVEIGRIVIKEGDSIEFKSKIQTYYKHGFGKSKKIDYALSTPKNIKIKNGL